MTDSPLVGLFSLAILIYSVVLHELAHGLMARSMGDRTAERMGRLTLNPIAHIDLFGSIILPILTWVTTGSFFGYAKPVPYDPSQLSDRRYGPLKVALAGPATNIALALLASAVIRLAGAVMPETTLEILASVVWINLILATFNLMPIPPLDGHWFLMTFLPARSYGFKVALYRYQFPLLFVFLFFVFPLVLQPLAGLAQLLTGIRFL